MKRSALLLTAALMTISGAAIAMENDSHSTMQNKSMMQTTTTTMSKTASTEMQGKTVLDLAASNSEFSTLAKAIKAAGLEQTLESNGPLTVFAPTNAAFDKLGQQKLNDLLKPENKEQLKQILTYHVVPQELPKDIASKTQPTAFETAEGQSLMLKQKMGQPMQIQNAMALKENPMKASNGQIIAIDTVLMPEANSKMGGNPSLISPAKPPEPQNTARVPSAEAPITPPDAPAASSEYKTH